MNQENNTVSNKPGFDMSLKMMLIYSLANVGALAIDGALNTFHLQYYVDEGLVKRAILISIAVCIGRIVDAIANPLVGYWSDTSYGPRGRRIPFILRGTVPMTVFFMLFFFPISKNEIVTFLFAAITCSGMLFFYTYTVAPYLALLPDLARTNDDRVKLSTYQSLMGIIGIILGTVVGGLLLDAFIAKNLGVHSYTLMAAIIGFLSLITFFVTGLKVRESPVLEENRLRFNLWESILPSLKNKPFLFYIFSISSFWIGFTALQASIGLVCIHLFGKSKGFGATVGMGGMIVVWLLALPLIFYLQKKFGKVVVFRFSFLAIAVFTGLLGFTGSFPAEIGLNYYLGLVFALGIPFAALLVLFNAVIGDIIDLDQKQTGFRREAMYYGMEGFFTKSTRGFGAILIGLLFWIFGNPTETNHTALILSGPICALFAFIGFLIFSRYPLKD